MKKKRELPAPPKEIKGNICDCHLLVAPLTDAYATFAPIGQWTGKPEMILGADTMKNPELMWESWFHEMIHFLEFDGGFELPEKSGVRGSSLVELLALGMWGLWKRNGWKLPGE